MTALNPSELVSLRPLETDQFDQFVAYLNDHLLDNGRDATYFQPLPRNASFSSSESAEAFRVGISLGLDRLGWRRLWVARDPGGRIIGHADLRSHSARSAEHRCLLGMGVDRDHRKNGLGNRLICQAEDWVKASELLEWIDLQVLSSNTPALRLYERAGFVRTGDVPDMFRIDGHSLAYTSMAKHVRNDARLIGGDQGHRKVGGH